MKGLMIKDLMNLKKQLRVYALFIVFYAFFAVYAKNMSFFAGVLIIFSVMLPVAAFSFDERVKWDRYALSMPLSRSDIVLAKYLLTLMFSLAGLALGILWNIVSGTNVPQSLFSALAVFAFGNLYAAIILPLFFRFNVEHARMIMMGVMFVPAVAIVVAAKSGLSLPGKSVLASLPYWGAALVVIADAASLALSLRLYDKRDV